MINTGLCQQMRKKLAQYYSELIGVVLFRVHKIILIKITTTANTSLSIIKWVWV